MNSAKPQFSQFELLLLKNQNHLGISILLLLVWIASSDGNIDAAEANELKEIAKSTGHIDEIDLIISIAKKGEIKSLQLASEIIKLHFSTEQAKLFIQMSIGIAIADGYLRQTENHILKYISDLISISSHTLNNIFIEITGKNFPHPADLSSSSYWQSRYNYQNNYNTNNNDQASQSRDPKRIKSLAILGLDETATLSEIKDAFRRLSKIHHPDRFASLGEEAVQAATLTFKRILSAYKYLTEYA